MREGRRDCTGRHRPPDETLWLFLPQAEQDQRLTEYYERLLYKSRETARSNNERAYKLSRVIVVSVSEMPCCYFTAFTMSKIGRYIATTMPPTTTPKNTIMIGSSSDSNALTAASTSSS